MNLLSLYVALALASFSSAFWRMECHSPIGMARIDPMVDPGEVSDHAHTIHGAKNFNFDSKYDDLMASDCTSCRVTQDKSAYWTPPLNFMYPNGTTVAVPQVGGMLAYYLLYGDNVKAFPKGFVMLAGDKRQRNFTLPVPDPPKSNWGREDSTQSALAQKALGFNCLNYNKNPPEATLYRHFLPDKEYLDANCPDGLRLELMFPSCWNGEDTDSPNHKSHMAYPDQVMTGSCPDGFDTRVPSMLFETIWATDAFNGVDGQFVLANGDPTGYGYHGDFMMGWDEGLLQQAVNTCTNPSGRIEDCPLFDLQTEAEGAMCTMDMPKQLKKDDCAGPREGLCGNVPVQSGPAYASEISAGNTEVPPPPPSSATSSASIPVLTYSPGTNMPTDKYGGGVTVANVKPEPTAGGEFYPAAEPMAPSPSSSSLSSAESWAAPPPAPSPAPSQAPPEVQVENRPSFISTSIYTSNGAVYEIYIQQVDVTVTATATPISRVKRHVHHHAHEHHA
ncbi:hypothetical protein K402DRAFT_332352 [Aulographum hederae CBS 113979]|uniref:DUF1996 domain-containing protein n=1 Tax=Aulographum hederae CBS 113979 TaxID=1176131 RepID=A0A6G1H0J1_9PEZI|nr:hypothetical protein K402DRAFT_332352 [Aulographum hederae CBS 113979]